MKRCNHCGAQIADDSRFCTECGKELEHVNVCPHCGAGVGDDDAFCQSCRKSFNEAQSSKSSVVSKRGLKKYLPYIIGAVVIFGIIGYYVIANKPFNTVSKANTFVGKVYKGSGTGYGLGIDMIINFIDEKECLCLSDWYRAYSPSKEIRCPYDVKDNHVIVHVDDDGTKYDMDFQIADEGKKIGFTNSDRDFLTLELVGGRQ